MSVRRLQPGAGHRLSRAAARSRPARSALAQLAALALRALGATWRIDHRGPDPLGPDRPAVIGAFWHRNLLIAAYHFRDRDFSVPVSRSRDGEWISAALAHLGYAPSPRGSSSRGGAAALRGLVGLVRAGTTVSIQTDGPRGPARRSKAGVIALARLTGAEIHPIAFSARPCFRFRSWDGTLLPAPFARVICAFGPAIRVAHELAEADEERIRQDLDNTTNEMTDRLDAELGLRERMPRD